MNTAYIEIVGGIAVYRWNLNQADLRHIGDFTRWRVAQWLHNRGVVGLDDFHAVCGDIDIPWDTEEARLCYGNSGVHGSCDKVRS
jgi:hypothetical protein